MLSLASAIYLANMAQTQEKQESSGGNGDLRQIVDNLARSVQQSTTK